jgi:hypothetical protein
MGDKDTARQLLMASVLVGMPALRQGELEYSVMPPVGLAVILFGKTLMLDSLDAKSSRPSKSP